MVAFTALATVLADQDAAFWRLVRGLAAWSQEQLRIALTAPLTLMAHLQLRCVEPFAQWPWRLATLVMPGYSDEEGGALRGSSCSASHVA